MQTDLQSKRLIHKEEDTALWAHKVPCRKPEKEKGFYNLFGALK